MNGYILYNGELYHFGVEGMRWGIRRYQNKDGSYKSNAKGRYNGSPISDKKVVKKLNKIDSAITTQRYKREGLVRQKRETEKTISGLKARVNERNESKSALSRLHSAYDKQLLKNAENKQSHISKRLRDTDKVIANGELETKELLAYAKAQDYKIDSHKTDRAVNKGEDFINECLTLMAKNPASAINMHLDAAEKRKYRTGTSYNIHGQKVKKSDKERDIWTVAASDKADKVVNSALYNLEELHNVMSMFNARL